MIPLLSTLVSYFGATAASCNNNASFFGLEAWYKYLHVSYDPATQSCNITDFNPDSHGVQNVLGAHSPFLLVGLAVIDDLLRIAALVAIGFIIAAGFRFITSQGNPEDASAARSMAINALIGLAISIIAVGAVSFIGSQLGGK